MRQTNKTVFQLKYKPALAYDFNALLLTYIGKKNLHTCLFFVSNVTKADPSLV